MSMNRKVFLSILAMDSYQRGYAAGINGVAGSKIGTASILQHSSGADFYFVGRNSGNDVIHDQNLGGDDELRFTAVDSKHIKAIRDGQDLILEVRNDTGALLNTVRLTDQFLGELNPTINKGKQFQRGVNQIVFSDGVIWDRFSMAMQVVLSNDNEAITWELAA